MSYSIFKYTITDTNGKFMIPKRAEFLDVQIQNMAVTLWFLVNPSVEKEKREFKIIGTGWPLDEYPGKFLGTVQMAQGSLVWHIFEK